MDDVIPNVRQALMENSDEKIKVSGQRFFKEEVQVYGVKTAVGLKIAREFFKTLEGRKKQEIFNLCEVLWQSGYMEEAFIACNWAYAIRDDFEPDDFKVFEKWLSSYVNNWASCDTLSNHTIGSFVEMYPEFLSGLKKWAVSENRWMRRASAVSLIIPARHGKFLNDIKDIAGILLTDKDDLVQKGYGWMLKAASEAHQKEIFEFVMEKKKLMPRTALRYAIEKMPKELKSKAMEKL
jgi:3-methyladenine DNA glycosylase AlkD